MEERFWSKVDIRNPNQCWEWKDYKDYEGYGKFRMFNRSDLVENDESKNGQVRAHRLAFFLWYGWWPDICRHYECNNPGCCNPRHLRDGTVRDNNLDTYRSGNRVENRDEKGIFRPVYWKEQ